MNLSTRLFLAVSFVAPFAFAQNTAFTNDVLALNPLGYWKFEGNLADASPQHNSGANGTVASPLGFTAAGGGSPVGDAAGGEAGIFTTSLNQYVSIAAGEPGGGTTFDLDTAHPFTLMAWVKTANEGLSGSIILAKLDPANLTGYGLLFFNDKSPGQVAIVIGSPGSAVIFRSVASINDGAWHLVIATYDGSTLATGVKLYIDGQRAATQPGGSSVAQINGSILNNVALAIGGPKSSLGGGVSTFEGLIDDVAVFGTELTPAQIQKLAGDAVSAPRILSQFAFGGGWYSAVYFANPGSTAVTVPVSFTADSGSPLSIPSLGGATTTLTLPPGGTGIIEAPNSGALQQGYVTAIPPPGVVGYGLFRQSVPGIADQEAVVPFSGANHTESVLTWDETSFTTAVAITNPSAVTVTVTIHIFKADGTLIGTSTLVLPPFTHTAKVLNSLPNLSGMVGNRGDAYFDINAGDVAVLGLRFSGSAFTSIPTVDR